MPSYLDDLASLRDGRFYKSRAEKPVQFKIDADGLGLSIELPGPQVMAATFALPWLRERLDVYRSGAALLGRPKGSADEPTALDQTALAADLRAALAALPDRAAGRPYLDARQAARLGAGRMDAYLADVVGRVRLLASVWKPSAERHEDDAAPAMTPAERKAAQRERERADEEASAREWLEDYLADPDEAPAPGERINAAELYELAVEVIGDYVEDGEEREDGGAYRVPRRRVFYAVADELFGTSRKRGAQGTRVYLMLDPATRKEITMNLADRVIDRTVEKLADEMLDEFGDDVRSAIVARLRAGDRLGALTLQRDRLDGGNVVDLDSRRNPA